MTNSTSLAVGRRIRWARERGQLSQLQLAQVLGVTPTAISYWEAGQRAPGVDEILRLADALGVQPSDLLPGRSARVLARARASQLATGDLADVVDDVLASFEDRQLPPLRRPLTKGSPTDMANAALRAAKQTHPPIDEKVVMKELGVTYVNKRLPEGLSGFVAYATDSPVVVVNSDDSPKRRRFTAAHELGHVLFAHHDTFHVDLTRMEGVPPDYNWRFEREANEFASSLLMPADLVRDELQSAVNPHIRTLAERFKVSEQAMGIRLTALGLTIEPSETVEIPF